MKKLLSLVLVAMLVVATPVSAEDFTDTPVFSDGTEYHTQTHIDIWGISTLNGLYPLTGIVTDIQYEVETEIDLVTITCANGNQFSWYADSSDCWELYDLASCIMDANGTTRVYDDEILLAHYAGSLDQLAQYTAK